MVLCNWIRCENICSEEDNCCFDCVFFIDKSFRLITAAFFIRLSKDDITFGVFNGMRITVGYFGLFVDNQSTYENGSVLTRRL